MKKKTTRLVRAQRFLNKADFFAAWEISVLRREHLELAARELGLDPADEISTELLDRQVRNAIEFIEEVGKGSVAD